MDSAPYRTITVKDSMSDLPDIRNGSSVRTMNYNGEPHCHYQRLVRENESVWKGVREKRREKITVHVIRKWRKRRNEKRNACRPNGRRIKT